VEATLRMSGIQYPSDLIAGFDVKISASGDRVDIVCAGTLESPDPVAALQPALLRLHADLLAAGVRTAHLEMQKVEYMNSSGLKCFMAWFLKAEQNPGNYIIEVVFDPGITWQQLSFTTMARIAPKVLRVAPVPKAKA
jgi:hypothetical protein